MDNNTKEYYQKIFDTYKDELDKQLKDTFSKENITKKLLEETHENFRDNFLEKLNERFGNDIENISEHAPELTTEFDKIFKSLSKELKKSKQPVIQKKKTTKVKKKKTTEIKKKKSTNSKNVSKKTNIINKPNSKNKSEKIEEKNNQIDSSFKRIINYFDKKFNEKLKLNREDAETIKKRFSDVIAKHQKTISDIKKKLKQKSNDIRSSAIAAVVSKTSSLKEKVKAKLAKIEDTAGKKLNDFIKKYNKPQSTSDALEIEARRVFKDAQSTVEAANKALKNSNTASSIWKRIKSHLGFLDKLKSDTNGIIKKIAEATEQFGIMFGATLAAEKISDVFKDNKFDPSKSTPEKPKPKKEEEQKNETTQNTGITPPPVPPVPKTDESPSAPEAKETLTAPEAKETLTAPTQNTEKNKENVNELNFVEEKTVVQGDDREVTYAKIIEKEKKNLNEKIQKSKEAGKSLDDIPRYSRGLSWENENRDWMSTLRRIDPVEAKRIEELEKADNLEEQSRSGIVKIIGDMVYGVNYYDNKRQSTLRDRATDALRKIKNEGDDTEKKLKTLENIKPVEKNTSVKIGNKLYDTNLKQVSEDRKQYMQDLQEGYTHEEENTTHVVKNVAFNSNGIFNIFKEINAAMGSAIEKLDSRNLKNIDHMSV